MEYLLGVITGLLISILILIFLSRKETEIKATIQEVKQRITKQKVEFLKPTSEDVDALQEVIKQNDAKGVDTKIEEL